MVDIEARFPLGRCSCPHYECRLWPQFRDTLKVERCKHLKAAREHFADSCIRTLSHNLRGDGE